MDRWAAHIPWLLVDNKTEGDRHREHVRNCVRDSQAWRERQADNLDLDQVVEKMIEQFGESYTETDKWYVFCLLGVSFALFT